MGFALAKGMFLDDHLTKKHQFLVSNNFSLVDKLAGHKVRKIRTILNFPNRGRRGSIRGTRAGTLI